MEFKLHSVTLPMRYAWEVAHGRSTERRSLIVELIDGVHRGYGEGPEIGYLDIRVPEMIQAIESARAELEAGFDHPGGLWNRMLPKLAHVMPALCAIDQAAHDLWGRRHDRPVYALWGFEKPAGPASNYTIGIDTPEVMAEKLREFAGWPVYKIKLGTGDPHKDLSIVEALRKETDAVFRVDANTAWTADQTIELSRPLKDLNVEFIEQPLPAADDEQMPRVKAESALPVIADESCQVESDVARCAHGFHGVNVKLCKCGGLTPAKRMLEHARLLGLKTMVGCMTETTVGISAIAQLLPLLDYVDMDGALLIDGDVAEGIRVEKGQVLIPDAPGHGFSAVTLPSSVEQ